MTRPTPPTLDRRAVQAGAACPGLSALVGVQAARTPDAIAIEHAGETLTYRELWGRARRLARALARRGVGAGDRVAVMLERDPALVVSLLGVLEAGAAYVPLDPRYPETRLRFMLADAGARGLVAAAAPDWVREWARGSGAVLLAPPAAGPGDEAPGDEPPAEAAARAVHPSSLAYVIYTSGSTGVPKGVMIAHGNAVERVRWSLAAFSDEEMSGMLASTSVSFDLSVFELFAPLARGGRVILADDALALPALAARERVSFINTVPSAMAELVRRGPLPASLAVVGLAGEPLPRRLVDEVRTAAAGAAPPRVLNLYGPSEDTTYSTAAEMPARWAGADERPPIGRPLPGTTARVLGDAFAAREAQQGELFLGGRGVSLGYLARPALTASRFLPDAASAEPGGRVYRTGDRVRRRADGALDYLGRADHQVKLRGFRVELGEVESALAARPGVREAAAGVHGEGAEAVLVAWIAAEAGADAGADEARLRAALGERLPAHMVPAVFVRVEALPRTANGKLDRAALPSPRRAAATSAALSPAERRLAALWSELLPVEASAPGDDFFALGGHSLLAPRLLRAAEREWGVELAPAALYAHPTLGALASYLESRRGAAAAPAAVASGRTPGESVALTAPQRQLWLFEQAYPGVAAYNVAEGFELDGALEVAALAAALAALAGEHEILRSRFALSDAGEPLRFVAGDARLRLPLVDLSALAEADAEAAAGELSRREAARPLALDGPLLRAWLARRAADRHLFFWTFHHVAVDGTTLAALERRLGELYAAAQGGRLAAASARATRRAPRARQEPLEEGRLRARAAELAALPELELPSARRRPATPSFRGHRLSLAGRLDEPTVAALLAAGRARGATPYMTLLALVELLLARLSGQTRFAVGTPHDLRAAGELELAGYHVDMMVVAAHVPLAGSFGELLDEARRATLAALAREERYADLVAALPERRGGAANPLFQVLFQVVPEEAPPTLAGLEVARRERANGSAKLDLELTLTLAGERLGGYLETASDLFDAAEAERLAARLRRLARAVAERPEARLAELPALSAEEERAIAGGFSRGPAGAAEPPLAHELFLRRAAERPEAPALLFAETAGGTATWSYARLERRSAVLAARLAAAGVDAGDRVGILLPRGPEQVAAVLAVLRAGAAYVPLDPSYPSARLELMLDDAAPRALVAAAGSPLARRFAGPLVDPAAAGGEALGFADRSVPRSSIAYVIYTSGSTGRPKGVALPHAALARLVAWQSERSTPRAAGRTLQFAALSFDVSFQEMFATFAAGGTLVLVDESTRGDSAALLALLDELEVERIFLPFVALQGLALACRHRRPPAALRHLITAGEQLRVTESLRSWLERAPGSRLHNQYGPSETHVTSEWRLEAGAEAPRLPPIGRPIDGHRAYVLDRWGGLAGVGVPGELALGGEGLARGYHARAALTAERFVPDAWSGEPGARLYRTGDRARWNAAGELVFLGRLDDQVKVRGYRIEPGEIAAALEAQPAVRAAAVVVREDAPGHRRLIAYAVAAEAGGAAAAPLLEALRRRLPEPMTPAAICFVDELPRTPSGKLDRRALLAPELAPERLAGAAGTASERELGAPRTPAEQLVLEVFREVFGDAVVGVGDDFFALGGHSLLATRVIARLRERLGVELTVRDLFEAPAIRALGERVEAALRGDRAATLPPVEPSAEPADGAPLAYSQQRFYFLQRMAPESSFYRLSSTVRLAGVLERAALDRAFEALVMRHAALRTTVEERGLSLAQRVHPRPLETLRWLDLSALPAAAAEREAERRLRAVQASAPDLDGGPLLRAIAIELGGERSALWLDAHHMISDGWTLGLLRRDLGRLYAAERRGEAVPPPPPLAYADYARWQRRMVGEGRLDADLDYFVGRLADAPEVLDLPTDRPRPPLPSFAGGVVRRPLAPHRARAVEALAARAGVTPFMVYLAAFAVLLARLARRRDLVVGLPVANRRQRELEEVVGCFVNTLALRLDLAGDAALDGAALLGRVRDAALGAYAHQDLPFDRVVEALDLERSAERNPVYQVSFQLLNTPAWPLALDGLGAEPWRLDDPTARLDLELFVDEQGEEPVAVLEHSSDLFDRTTAERWLESFERLVAGLAAEPSLPVERLRLSSAAQRHQLLVEWNDTAAELAGGELCLHQLFERAARRAPRAEALRFAGESLSYGELDARASALARRLEALGVGPESRVAVCLERGFELPTALLAVLKAGGVYVPLDPHLPPRRLAFMLEDAGAGWVLTLERWRELVAGEGAEVVALDALDEAAAAAPSAGRELDPMHGAYAIYTSGSTGRPKGVLNAHAGIVNRLAWMQRVYRLEPGDRVLHKTPVTFDVSVWELFWPLAAGATMVIAEPEGHKDAAYLLALMRDERVTVAHFVPSMLALFLDQPIERADSLRQVVCSGEALPRELAEAFLARSPARLDNLYGPTEAAVDVTRWRVRRGEPRLPIGRPIANLGLRVVDPAGGLAAHGAPGELLLTGRGLARGYLGRPALTAERFVPDAWASEPGARAYRTGDLARYETEGAVSFLGRIDFQVKLRGFRIELGEIEQALAAHPAVRQAVVAVRAVAGDPRLAAYVVLEAESEAETAALRAHLAERLPEHMVPALFVFLDELPLGPNGKLDRGALPDPTVERAPAARMIAPRTETEVRLAEIWRDLLAIEELGVEDDFFALGGHSLLAIHVMTHVRNAWGLDLPVATLFRAPTVARLAELIDGAGVASASVVVPLGGQQHAARPFFCVHGIGGNVFRLVRLARLMAARRPFYGIQGWSDMADTSYLASVETMARRYVPEIRRVQPHGPYLVGGYSLGSFVAYEMARLLVAEGEEVAFVGLLDVPAPSADASPEAARAELAKGSFEGGIAQELGIPIERDKLFALDDPRQRLQYVLVEGAKSGALPPGFTPQDAMRYIDVYSKTGLATSSYAACAYPGRVALFSTAEEGGEDPTLGWSGLTGGVDVYRIPGDHFSLVMEPHVDEVAATLLAALDEAERRHRGCAEPPTEERLAATSGAAREG